MPYGLAIDLDALHCVDMGHRWHETFYGRAPSGKRKGNPIRASVCLVCGSARIEYFRWDGKVQDRDYDPDDAYINNARMLGDYKDRRTLVRKAKNDRLKKEGNRGHLNGQDH